MISDRPGITLKAPLRVVIKEAAALTPPQLFYLLI